MAGECWACGPLLRPEEVSSMVAWVESWSSEVRASTLVVAPIVWRAFGADRYVWVFDRMLARHVPASLAYPKVSLSCKSPVARAELVEVDALSESERGEDRR